MALYERKEVDFENPGRIPAQLRFRAVASDNTRCAVFR